MRSKPARFLSTGTICEYVYVCAHVCVCLFLYLWSSKCQISMKDVGKASWDITPKCTWVRFLYSIHKIIQSIKRIFFDLNPLSANFTKRPNTLKQFIGPFVKLALKGLNIIDTKLFVWNFRHYCSTEKITKQGDLVF